MFLTMRNELLCVLQLGLLSFWQSLSACVLLCQPNEFAWHWVRVFFKQETKTSSNVSFLLALLLNEEVPLVTFIFSILSTEWVGFCLKKQRLAGFWKIFSPRGPDSSLLNMLCVYQITDSKCISFHIIYIYYIYISNYIYMLKCYRASDHY